MAEIESIADLLPALFPASQQLVTDPPQINNLDEKEPTGFKKEQIIYRKVIPVGYFKCRYEFIDKPTPITTGFNFDEFVTLAATDKYVKNDLMLPEKDPMGILVKKDSYIFLHLDPTMPTFMHDTQGVALGNIVKPQEKLYGHLHYVTDDGDYYDYPFPGCRLVFFKARFWENTGGSPQYIQKFWIALSTKIWVDPDVRYPGNGSD